jgi:signal transduction histidine kinase
MTERVSTDGIEHDSTGVGGSAIRGRFGLTQRGFDIAVALAVFGASIVNVATQDAAGISKIPVAGLLMLAIASAALVWRRGAPLAVLAVALTMAAVWTALDYPSNPVFHILASLYAAGRYVREWTISLAALTVAIVVVGFGQVADSDPVSDLFTGVILTVLAWYVGRLIRNRVIVARERAELLELRRASEAARAIADARAGIARELHDVVAHNVSVMTVQAGAARMVVAEDPDRAQEALGAVEQAGRRALDELRHLLGVLRPEAATGELGPQPALNQVHQLVDQLSQTGMKIALQVDVRSELPVRTDLFAYRIVQEALTNALKHGGPDAAVQVSVVEADGHLDIAVTNAGTAEHPQPGSGQGIIGMRERAILLGGTFQAGPRPEGGFRVMARFPIGEK